MVIQYNNLPFKLAVINEVGERDYSVQDFAFCDDIEDINNGLVEAEIKIRENSNVFLRFRSNIDCILEMDGFDGIDIPETRHDDGTYLQPSDGKVKVFSYESSPLPPGLYIIKVKTASKNYFTSFEVLPARLDDRAWQIMATDVFESIKLMAFQLAVQKVSVANSFYEGEEFGVLLLKMNVIDQYFHKVIAALDDLRLNPHSKISKKYVLSSKAEQHSIDFQCNKLNSMKINIDRAYIPLRYTDYQITENAYVKRMVLSLDKVMRLFIKEINEKKIFLEAKVANDFYGKDKNTYEYNRNCRSLSFLELYYSKARKIISIINKLKEALWFKEVNANIIQRVPSQSMLDPRYAILSRVSKELEGLTIKYDMDNRLSFIWHNSAKLYELWGVIKLVEALQNLGFELVEGLNVDRIGYELKISGLASGNSFMMKRDSLEIKVTYEPTLLAAEDKSGIESDPVYTVGKHVTPDCKIDYFYNLEDRKLYMGSLIIDFKYRSKYAFWNNYRENCRHQLMSYVNDTRSKNISNRNEMSSLRMRPVVSVWALYPDRFNVDEEETDENLFIKLLSFVPGYQQFISRHLQGVLEDYIYPEIEAVGRASM